MDNEYAEYLEQIENELKEAKSTNRQLHNAQMSLYENSDSGNIVKWQLDLKDELDKIYHLLKGNEIRMDEKGELRILPAQDPNVMPFNEFGTKLIMNVLSFYLNKNTILSNYDEKQIERKVLDFGIEISDLIFNRYEEMMMTTTFEQEYFKLFGRTYNKKYIKDSEVNLVRDELERHLQGKIKLYPIMVLALTDMVHSAYLRALGGIERKELRTARTVNQNEALGRVSPVPMVQQKKFSMLKPSTWI